MSAHAGVDKYPDRNISERWRVEMLACRRLFPMGRVALRLRLPVGRTTGPNQVSGTPMRPNVLRFASIGTLSAENGPAVRSEDVCTAMRVWRPRLGE